jgi:hypothetical protein
LGPISDKSVLNTLPKLTHKH